MKPRLIVILIILTLAPLATAGVLGVRLAQGERAMTEKRLEALLVSKLAGVQERLAALIREREDTLSLAAAASRGNLLNAAEAIDRLPEVEVFFALDMDGELAVPLPPEYEGPIDADFLRAAQTQWNDAGDLPPLVTKGGKAAAVAPPRGWHTWYHGAGLQLIHWWRLPEGGLAGVQLRRSRFLSDVIAALPDTRPDDPAWAGARVVLCDAQGAPIYQWGLYGPEDRRSPAATLTLDPPLAAWRLEYYADPRTLALPRAGVMFNLLAGIAAMAVALTALAVYFYRESTRAAREASRRVSFVNQVSHELKTPLTNIRMYAELLEDEVPEEGAGARYLEVIVSESQRLSRLIGNVLTFGRGQRKELKLRPQPTVLDDTVKRIVERVRPALQEKGVECQLDLGAPARVLADSDAVEQILGNLLSNVEKYAVNARTVGIATRQGNGTSQVTVADDGPGIPPGMEAQIFAPFFRCQDGLTEGVSGTGIGLAIARDLARLHGGDLRAESAGPGATFVFTLATPEDQGGEQ